MGIAYIYMKKQDNRIAERHNICLVITIIDNKSTTYLFSGIQDKGAMQRKKENKDNKMNIKTAGS